MQGSSSDRAKLRKSAEQNLCAWADLRAGVGRLVKTLQLDSEKLLATISPRGDAFA